MQTRLPLQARPLVFCLLIACTDTFAQPADSDDWGRSKETAIEVCKPQGQRQYLARLVCPDRSHPAFERSGNVGPRHDFPADVRPGEITKHTLAAIEHTPLAAGEVDHHTVDRYEVRCGEHVTTLYLDMYHCDAPAPREAPAGFSIAN